MQGSMSRRLFVITGTLTIASMARAQPSMSQFVGRWKGHVPGLGDAEIIVAAVRADGQVDGQMVFPDQQQTFTFGDKLDIAKSINHGVIQEIVTDNRDGLGRHLSIDHGKQQSQRRVCSREHLQGAGGLSESNLNYDLLFMLLSPARGRGT